MYRHVWSIVEVKDGVARHRCELCGAELCAPVGTPPEDSSARFVTAALCRGPRSVK